MVTRLLAKKPSDRFPTAAAVRFALEDTLRTPEKHRARVRGTANAFVAAAMALSIAAGLVSYRAMHTTPRGPVASVESVAPAVITEVAQGSVAAAPATGTANLDETLPPEPLAMATPTPTPTPTPTSTPLTASTPTPLTTPPPAAPEPHPPAVLASLDPPSHAGKGPGPTPDRADLVELADARDAAKDRPSDRRALKTWATAALRAGAMREARRAGEAWALKDDGVEPRLFLASVLEATGHRSEAKAILAQWIDLHPDSPEAKKVQAHLEQTSPRAERVMHKTIER